MEKLINFAVNLMEKENIDPHFMPSQNRDINPTQNRDINTTQNREINSTQNRRINRTQTPYWKRNQWELFKETVLWEYLTDEQKEKCKIFLQSL